MCSKNNWAESKSPSGLHASLDGASELLSSPSSWLSSFSISRNFQMSCLVVSCSCLGAPIFGWPVSSDSAQMGVEDLWICGLWTLTLESSLESSPDSGKENLAPSDLHFLSYLIKWCPLSSKASIAFLSLKGSRKANTIVRIMETYWKGKKNWLNIYVNALDGN